MSTTAEAVPARRSGARPAGALAAVRAEPLLIGLVVLAALLRFATIDQQSYWLDEAFTVGLLREDFPHMLKYMTETEATPPLYYVLAWPWAHVLRHRRDRPALVLGGDRHGHRSGDVRWPARSSSRAAPVSSRPR